MTVEVFFRATPWALPGTVMAAIALVMLARTIGRRISSTPVLAWLYATALAGYVCVTVTPGRTLGLWGGPQPVSFQLSLPRLSNFESLNPDSLNVYLGFLLGVPTVLVLLDISHLWPIWLSVLLVVAVECVQGLLPVLGRSGFLLDDVFRNVLGLILGIGVGAFVWPLVRKLGVTSARTDSTYIRGTDNPRRAVPS